MRRPSPASPNTLGAKWQAYAEAAERRSEGFELERNAAESTKLSDNAYLQAELVRYREALEEIGTLANKLEDEAFDASTKGTMMSARAVQFKADKMAGKALSVLAVEKETP